MSNVATTQNPNVEEKKTTASIEIEEVMTFDPNIKSAYKNTIELAKIVDSLFMPALRDYVGCKICLNNGDVPGYLVGDIPAGKLYVNLYFKECSAINDDMIPNVNLRSKVAGRSKFTSLMNLSGAGAGRMYDVTTETYEALDEFRFMPNRKTNWNNLTTEVVSSYGYNVAYNNEIVVCISGLDLEKIINKVYGTRTDEGIFQYQAVPVQFVANANGEYLVCVTQLDVRKLDDLRRSLGGPINRTDFHHCVK